MEKIESIYEGKRERFKSDNSELQKEYRKRYRVVLKDSSSKVVVDERYIDICNSDGEFLIGFVNVKEIYINKEIDLNIADLFRLAKYVKVFLIDGNGNLIGQFKRFKF